MINPDLLVKKVFLLIQIAFLFLVLTNAYSQPGWISQNSSTTYDLNSVSFANTNTGFVVGGITTAPFTSYGVILKTTNGGMNWFSLDSLPAIALAVRFWDENTGYVTDISYDWQPPGHSHVHLYKTTDGGNSFNSEYFWNLPAPCYIFLTGSESGYVVGDRGLVGKITDSLTSFKYVGNSNLYSAFFLDTATGFAVGGGWNGTNYEGTILRTTNGGNNWGSVPSGTSIPLRSIFFANDTIGYIAGFNGTFLKTTNGGDNWFSLPTGNSGNYRTVYFTSVDTGYISSNTIYKTTNGGVNWSSQSVPSGVNLNSMCFPATDTGFVVGDNGVILKTVTGGLTNAGQTNNVIPESFKLYQNYPNPFNPTTNIRFEIPQQSLVKLIVYNILGREIATLVNEKLSAGSYETDWNGTGYPSGVYFYKIIANDFVNVKKMVLIK